MIIPSRFQTRSRMAVLQAMDALLPPDVPNHAPLHFRWLGGLTVINRMTFDARSVDSLVVLIRLTNADSLSIVRDWRPSLAAPYRVNPNVYRSER